MPEAERSRREPETQPAQFDREALRQHLRCAVRLFLLLMATSLGAILVSRAVPDAWVSIDVMMTVVDAAIILVFVKAAFPDLRPLLEVKAFSMRTVGLVVVSFVTMYVFMNGYFIFLEHMFGLETMDYTESGTSVFTMVILISICPAVFEELAFRGVIMDRLGRVLKPGETLVLQAALFSVMHLTPAVFISHFVMGLLFGMLRFKTKSLYPGMFLHAMWNGLVLAEQLF